MSLWRSCWRLPGDPYCGHDGGGDKHTLAHVIQQRQGPVTGKGNGSGLRVSDPSDRFERAAEANATRALSTALPAAGATDAVQRAEASAAPVADVLSSQDAENRGGAAALVKALGLEPEQLLKAADRNEAVAVIKGRLASA